MSISTRASLLLASTWLLAAATALGQQNPGPAERPPVSADLAVNYSLEHAQVAPGSCGCFWFQGAGADAAVTFWRGVGIATVVTGEHGNPGINIDKITYVLGPRYTYALATRHAGLPPRMQLFGEVLFGGVHGFNSGFPTTSKLNPTGRSFAFETGGGINAFVSKRFAVRALEVDYLRTELPNNYSNVQNDLRLGFGVTYHLNSLKAPLN